jgi:hypothetical protein
LYAISTMKALGHFRTVHALPLALPDLPHTHLAPQQGCERIVIGQTPIRKVMAPSPKGGGAPVPVPHSPSGVMWHSMAVKFGLVDGAAPEVWACGWGRPRGSRQRASCLCSRARLEAASINLSTCDCDTATVVMLNLQDDTSDPVAVASQPGRHFTQLKRPTHSLCPLCAHQRLEPLTLCRQEADCCCDGL